MTKTTESRWQSLIREQERSGLTVGEFAGRRGLAASTVYWWRSRLRRKVAAAMPSLVPVEVVDAGTDRSAARIEVQVGAGIVVRVPPGVHEADLQAVLRALGHQC